VTDLLVSLTAVATWPARNRVVAGIGPRSFPPGPPHPLWWLRLIPISGGRAGDVRRFGFTLRVGTRVVYAAVVSRQGGAS
jgi:hypothetical protein